MAISNVFDGDEIHNHTNQGQGNNGTLRNITGTINVGFKDQGSLPSQTTWDATQFQADTNEEGGYEWLFGADTNLSGPIDLSSVHRILVGGWQFNAPNRMQLETIANAGIWIRAFSGADGNWDTEYDQYTIAGIDSFVGKAQSGVNVWAVDGDAGGAENTAGTFDRTDWRGWLFGIHANAVVQGSQEIWTFIIRTYGFTTEKNSADIPQFTSIAVTGINGATDVDDVNEELDLTAHGFTNGMRVRYDDGGGTTIGGLIDGDDYYVEVVSANVISLHLTYIAAITAATPINLTDGSGSNHSLTNVANWQDLVDAIQGFDRDTKIHQFVQRLTPSLVFNASPWQIGDGGTTLTIFDDGGDTLVFPANADATDPRFRVSFRAFRGYVNLGTNDEGNLRGGITYSNDEPLDYDVNGDAFLTFSNYQINGSGDVLFDALGVTSGNGISGTVTTNLGANIAHLIGLHNATTGTGLDGSTFNNDVTLGNGTNGEADTDLSDITIVGDLRIDNGTTNLIVDFTNVTVTGDVLNDGTGTLTINSLGTSSLTTTEPGTGNGQVNILNTQPLSISGVTEGTPCKIVANETVGTVTEGDVLMEAFANSSGVASGTISYESAFEPSGLDVIVRARNQGILVAAISDDGGVFTDETAEAASVSINDITFLPTVPVAGDAYYYAHTEQFSQFKIDITTVLVGNSVNFALEYWNGTIWTGPTGIGDETNGYKIIGEGIVSYNLPGDWATTTVNSQGPFYYVRIRLVSFTTITTAPIGKTATIDATRYLPYVGNRVITSTGLPDTATWTIDTISKFTQV